MLNVNILGPGCANCFLLEGLTIATLELLMEDTPEAFDNHKVTMQHLSDPQDFRRYMLFSTPGLVINEKLVCAGRLPSAVEIKKWVLEALNMADQQE
jgi:hypothetical protein